ncbi:MAG: hypothetical protein M3R25_01795 [Bacteroidota bacterium]|nr:hypothetical protein [Bacteroidota bacterium]
MPSRQLAAIMFAGIVDSSLLMQADEDLAIHQLDKLKLQLEKITPAQHGRIIELRGDGALCMFSSNLEAVQAALALQIEMQKSPIVPLRISIHSGDVVIDEDTIYGDVVNIASRIETLAVSGSVFISGKVYEDIKNQHHLDAITLGRFHLQHVKELIDLYALRHPDIITPDASHLEGRGEKILNDSILVLPFLNLSNDAEQDYFSDGLTEELISNLSRLKDMRVISRTTSMKYKGASPAIKKIGEETGVTYIMEGSVRTQGNMLRITAQVVDVAEDSHLWADTFQGTLDDIFDIQEKVASKIVEALRIQLTDEVKDTLQKRYTGNPEAYQLYLQGRFLWNKRNEASLITALRFFEMAIQKDPEYALAWVGVADTYNLLGEHTTFSRRELHPQAKAAIQKALSIDPLLAEAHISLALLIMLNEWDWMNSGKEFRIGISLNPNYATGHHWYGEWLLFNSRTEEALNEITLAVDLDPVSQAILKDQGIFLYYARQYDLAIMKALKTFELDQDFVSAHRLLALCYTEKGMYPEAARENQIWGNLINNLLKTNLGLAHIYAASGDHDKANEIVNEMLVNHSLGSNDYRSLAVVYAAMGDADRAFIWLEKSYEQHEESLCSISVDPKMDLIRHDPRFDVMVKKIGL